MNKKTADSYDEEDDQFTKRLIEDTSIYDTESFLDLTLNVIYLLVNPRSGSREGT